jgi:hypothetical protein
VWVIDCHALPLHLLLVASQHAVDLPAAFVERCGRDVVKAQLRLRVRVDELAVVHHQPSHVVDAEAMVDHRHACSALAALRALEWCVALDLERQARLPPAVGRMPILDANCALLDLTLKVGAVEAERASRTTV